MSEAAKTDKTTSDEKGMATLYRMKDLVEHSGLRRETIHFYITEGLLPPAVKKQRNSAWYGEEHLQRLDAIRDLQKQQFLPLKAIKSILNDTHDHAFTSEQRHLIEGLRGRYVSSDESSAATVPLRDVARRTGVTEQDIREAADQQIVAVHGSASDLRMTPEDETIIEAWARLRRLGLTPERGFAPRDMEFAKTAIELLLDNEIKLFAERFGDLGEDEAWQIIERATPVVNEIFGTLHKKRIRRFIAEFGTEPDDKA